MEFFLVRKNKERAGMGNPSGVRTGTRNRKAQGAPATWHPRLLPEGLQQGFSSVPIPGSWLYGSTLANSYFFVPSPSRSASSIWICMGRGLSLNMTSSPGLIPASSAAD
jgi:hypothetical protein